jgi:YVTN family beta-propeller protein
MYLGGIFVISDKTNQVMTTIPLGNDPYPTALIYDSGKREIYVSYQGLPEKNPANFISVISDATNSVIATVPLGSGIPFNAPVGPGSYDSATGEIYMVNSINSSVLVISDETHTVVDSIQLEPSPISVGYDPAKRVLFVGTADNMTYIISDKTKSIVETVPISCFYTFYDSGKRVMIALNGASSLQFVSDNSLPSVSPTSTVPEFPSVIIVTILLIVLALAISVFKRKKTKSS